MQGDEGDDGENGGGERKDEEVPLHPDPLQALVKEESGEAEGRGGLVQHDGQEHDHLHVRLVGGGGGAEGDAVRCGVDHEA